MISMSGMFPPKRDTEERSTMAPTSPESSEAAAPGESAALLSAVHAGLRAGAEAATALGMPLDEFMALAWSSFVDARPGLREHLAEAQLAQQLAQLRTQGRIGQA